MTARLDAIAVDREVRTLLAAARWAAADLEQVLATTARLDLGDGDSWVREWTAAGGEAWAAARNGGGPGRYLHAASYYGAALALIDGSDGLVDEAALRRRQRDCWERALRVLGGERVTIPAGDDALAGCFVPAGAGARAAVVVDTGDRMAGSEAWVHVGAAARARGHHFLGFGGSVLAAAPRDRQDPQPLVGDDWAVVLGSVVDLLAARPDVDPGAIAVAGLELGGYRIACGLLAEHRFGSAILVPGIHDASRPWLDLLPERARLALLDRDGDRFRRELRLAVLFTPELEGRLRRRTGAADLTAGSLGPLLRWLDRCRLDRRQGELRTPTLVCEAAAGDIWPARRP